MNEFLDSAERLGMLGPRREVKEGEWERTARAIVECRRELSELRVAIAVAEECAPLRDFASSASVDAKRQLLRQVRETLVEVVRRKAAIDSIVSGALSLGPSSAIRVREEDQAALIEIVRSASRVVRGLGGHLSSLGWIESPVSGGTMDDEVASVDRAVAALQRRAKVVQKLSIDETSSPSS